MAEGLATIWVRWLVAALLAFEALLRGFLGLYMGAVSLEEPQHADFAAGSIIASLVLTYAAWSLATRALHTRALVSVILAAVLNALAVVAYASESSIA